MTTHKKIFVIILFLVLPFFISLAQEVENGELSGWAWSENIGWISLSCENTGTCGTSDYKVQINSSSGDLSGYAWSENVGWIDFKPAGPYPSEPDESAKYDFDSAQINGWAKAVAGSDGWDGWIKMSATNPNYAVTKDGLECNFTGYAWGSDVIGWVHFEGTNYSVDIDQAFCELLNAYPNPWVDAGEGHALFEGQGHTHSGAEAKIVGGDNLASYTWSFDSCPATCPTLLDASGELSGKTALISGPSYTPNVVGDYTLLLTVLDTNNDAGTATVTETAAPPPQDFTLSSANDIYTIKIGPSPADSIKTTITVSAFGGFSSDVNITVESADPALPEGVEYNFSDSTLDSSEYSSGSEFWVRVPADTTPDNYLLTLKGEGGGLIRNVTVQLSVVLLDPLFREVRFHWERFLGFILTPFRFIIN